MVGTARRTMSWRARHNFRGCQRKHDTPTQSPTQTQHPYQKSDVKQIAVTSTATIPHSAVANEHEAIRKPHGESRRLPRLRTPQRISTDPSTHTLSNLARDKLNSPASTIQQPHTPTAAPELPARVAQATNEAHSHVQRSARRKQPRGAGLTRQTGCVAASCATHAGNTPRVGIGW